MEEEEEELMERWTNGRPKVASNHKPQIRVNLIAASDHYS